MNRNERILKMHKELLDFENTIKELEEALQDCIEKEDILFTELQSVTGNESNPAWAEHHSAFSEMLAMGVDEDLCCKYLAMELDDETGNFLFYNIPSVANNPHMADDTAIMH